jgi:D-serine deaminase-like pyridoxal phosphate-dependent protein
MSAAGATGAWARPWRRVREQIAEEYGRHVGRPVGELCTPALLLDLDVLERNIAAMAAALPGAVALRPHTKVQKSPDLALLQVEAGAVGVTVATVWEAAAMVAAGITDVLIANQVIGAAKVRALAALARHGRITVAVDHAGNIDDLSRAATAAGTELGVLVDLDVGMGRCGARSAAAAVELAGQVAAGDGLTLRGVQAYEGHCMLEPDPATRHRLATAAMDYAGEVAAQVRAVVPTATTLSGGGTGTYAITGRHPAVTEIQAGSYVFMDAFHGDLVAGFEVSLSVLTTVMARHGQTIVLDAGRKSVGIDFVSPPIVGYNYEARYYAEEHALFDVAGSVTLQVGDQARLACGYAPTTVNLHDVFYAVRDGRVAQVWPVFPRGPGHHGFLAALGAG